MRSNGGMIQGRHLAICAALVAVAVVLLAIGAGPLALIAPLACAAMMGAMIWMMVRAGGRHGGHR